VNTLVLRLSRMNLLYALFSGEYSEPALSGEIEGFRAPGLRGASGGGALSGIREECAQALDSGRLDAVAVLVKFGGTLFHGPVVCDETVLAQLRTLAPSAPLHLPSVVALARTCRETFADIPVVLVFDTAFFADLPAREHSYALEAGLMRKLDLRRFGYHGLYHEAACKQSALRRRETGVPSAPRILSICLEPRPEVAAVLGHRPLTVTGGATPLEGLPGQTTCGEIDPSLVIHFAKKMGWGPEQINNVLTRESGLLGLTGRTVTLEDLFLGAEDSLREAREIMRYRILQACGAGMAALGGLDTIVFSGCFASAGEVLGPWLRTRLSFRGGGEDRRIALECFREPLERIIADRAQAALLSRGNGRLEDSAA
jgi:acetate kinase